MSFIKLCEKFDFEPFSFLARIIESEFTSMARPLKVLDLGAGDAHYWKRGRLAKLVDGGQVEVLCIDAGYRGEKEFTNNKLSYLNGILPNILEGFSDKEFDICLSFDVIEHLTKSEGFLMMYQMERIKRKYSIIFTPNGFAWQPPSNKSIFDAHISAWSIREFKQFGFTKVRGFVGFKVFIGPFSIIKEKYRSRLFRELVALSQLFVFRFPKYSYGILAISDSIYQATPQKDFS
jgi:hypothetical protein